MSGDISRKRTMAIKRGKFVIECDKCGEQEDLDTDSFEEAKELAEDYMDNNGWRTYREKGSYINACSACA
jgi:hypothetical protein